MQQRHYETNRHFRNDPLPLGSEQDSRSSRDRGWMDEGGGDREARDYEGSNLPSDERGAYRRPMMGSQRFTADEMPEVEMRPEMARPRVPRFWGRPDGGRFEGRYDQGRFEGRPGDEPGRFEGRSGYDQGRFEGRLGYESRPEGSMGYDQSTAYDRRMDQGRFEQPRFESGHSLPSGRAAHWPRGLRAENFGYAMGRFDEGRFEAPFEQLGRGELAPFDLGRFEPSRFEAARGVGTRPRMGRGPKGYKRSDERIKEDVCDRIASLDIDASNVEVDVKDGEVMLSGSVPERMMKYTIEQCCDRVFGVHEINNHLRVKAITEPGRGRNGSAERVADDAARVDRKSKQ